MLFQCDPHKMDLRINTYIITLLLYLIIHLKGLQAVCLTGFCLHHHIHSLYKLIAQSTYRFGHGFKHVQQTECKTPVD